MRTDTGVVRARNEDAAHVDEEGRFVVLADGMGGPGFGDIASSIAVQVIAKALRAGNPVLSAFEDTPTDDTRDAVRHLIDAAMHMAHDSVQARARAEPEKHGMGTTADVVVVAGNEAIVAHVGDSRTYLVREGRAHRVTSDHTVAETLKRAGALTEEEAEKSPLRQMLSSAIGISSMVMIDHAHVALRAGDRLLICSDGLYNYFTDDDLASRLTLAELDDALAELIAEARARGGHDNITGIVIETFSKEAGPVAGVSEDALASLVEHVLREESVPNHE